MSAVAPIAREDEQTGIYGPSTIKPKRLRATKAEMGERYDALQELLAEIQPATVRQTFYQAEVRDIIAHKTEEGYRKVQKALVYMRKDGIIPYAWIVDNTRWMRKSRSHNSVKDAIEEAALYYRKNLWRDSGVYCEVWLEKDALAGSFLWSSAQQIKEIDKPTFIYHLGDYDPDGQHAGKKIEEGLREFCPGMEIHFERLALNPDQIMEWNLPTRPTKKSSPRAKKFPSELSAELDAINPLQLRQIVRSAIERHMPAREFRILKTAERSERAIIGGLVRMALRGIESDGGRQ
jgi:hypothetical protein